jgi:hypothetical protein
MAGVPQIAADLMQRRKPFHRFGRIANTTADPESSKSANGDLQHLREMTFRTA